MELSFDSQTLAKVAAVGATATALLGGAAFLSKHRSAAPSSYSIQATHGTNKNGEGAPRIHRSCANGFVSTLPGITTLHDITHAATEKFASKECIGVRSLEEEVKIEKEINGAKKTMSYYKMSDYKWINYGVYGQRVANFAAGLVSLGLKRHESLSIFEETRLEWTIACQAAFRQGMQLLTVYANLGEDALAYSLGLAQSKVLLCNGSSLSIISKIMAQVPSLKTIIFVDKMDAKIKKTLEEAGLKLVAFEEVESIGEAKPVEADPPQPDDVALCMFTSGTTGNPKGVLLTHKNIVAAISATYAMMIDQIGVLASDVYCSFLPLAHILAFVLHFVAVLIGVRVGFGTARTLRDEFMHDCKGDFRELRPTLFVGVPTIYERVKKAIESKIAALSPAMRKLFETAFYLKKLSMSSGIPIPLIDRIFAPMRDQLGGRVRLMVSGGAALHPDIQQFMSVCMGVKIIQGYGLTECCGPVSVQEISDGIPGSIGAPIPCLEFKLVDVPDMGYTSSDQPNPRGEICIRGPSIFSGYLNNEAETKKALDADGWFHTGDVGLWTSNGTLRIIDRVKNLIKPSHGEYIALEKLEAVYRTCPMIDNIVVYADSHHFDCIGIVTPNRAATEQWKDDSAKLEAAILKALQQTAQQNGLKSIEFIRAVHVADEEWTPENGMLTAAQKIKRKPIVDRHQAEIDAMYKRLSQK